MGKELVISSNRHETKVAILEDDQLVEIFFQRANEYSLAGSIHKGRVTRVLPGMQSAFVDIGLERDAFLYVSDFFEEHEEYDRIGPATDDRGPVEKPPPAPAPRVAAAAERPPVPPAVAPLAVENPAPPAGPTERPDEADGRDPRGRRSRRRRSRGHGFPESKYAQGAPRRAPPEETPQVSSEAEEEFPVLPGESLAKYTRSADEPPDVAPEVAEAAVEPEPEAAVPPPPEPEDAGLADAPEVALAEFEVAAVEEQVASIADESSEAEIADEEGAAAEEAAVEESASEEAAEAVDASSPQEPASAAVREPGGRYMHRVPRRLRRKTRGTPSEEMRGAQPVVRPEPAHAPRTPQEASPDRPERPQPSIADLLRERQEILVQIAKEPLGQKGARITSHIALPGRYVVYMPTLEHLGVSRKVSSDEERFRLKRILQAHRVGISGGFIVRTAGEGHSESEIAHDMNFLYNLWLDIRQKAEKRAAPVLLHHDVELVERILRDQMADGFKTVWLDNEELYESVLRFLERFQPAMVARVKLWTRSVPIFDAFNITAELEKALRPKVWLKSGGYIVINQTEALVAIDVNTGKFVGKSNRLEDTIVKINTEAVKEIVRQMRLRDLGGIIVVDFIDMDERKNRQKVMQALEEAMRSDRAPYKVLQFNDFGLVAITRKRVKQSLERTLCAPCPYCEGAGYVKSPQTIIGDILQEAHKVAGEVEGKEVVLRVHPEVAKVLKSTGNTYLEELEEILKRPVLVTGDHLLHQEKFDLA